MPTSITKYCFSKTTCSERSVSVVCEKFFVFRILNCNRLLLGLFRLFSVRKIFLRLMSENLLSRIVVDATLPFGGELNGRQRPQNKRVMAYNA